MQYEATVPTVADRVAQTVVKRFLEPLVESKSLAPRAYERSASTIIISKGRMTRWLLTSSKMSLLSATRASAGAAATFSRFN